MGKVSVCLLMVCALAAMVRTAEIRTRRDASIVAFPDASAVASKAIHDEGPILSEAPGDAAGPERSGREAAEDYADDEDDDAEGRHLLHIKRKLKRKFKPHKFKPQFGYGGGPLGGFGHGGYGGYGQSYDCRKLHGCGGGYGGWQQPSHGPIAPFAGPNPVYGGWNPGYSRPGYNRPSYAQPQVASWNFGPFQASLGFAG